MATTAGSAGQGRDLSQLPEETLWYAEDLRIGDWMNLGSVAVDLDEVLEFAGRYDPLPIHLDGGRSPFGTVVASGVHTLALFSSLASRRFIPRLALVAGKGIDTLRLPTPVYPGSRLTGAVEIVEIVFRSTRADVCYRSSMVDASGREVLNFIAITVVARRTRPE